MECGGGQAWQSGCPEFGSSSALSTTGVTFRVVLKLTESMPAGLPASGVGPENHWCTWHYLGNERLLCALGARRAFELPGGRGGPVGMQTLPPAPPPLW